MRRAEFALLLAALGCQQPDADQHQLGVAERSLTMPSEAECEQCHDLQSGQWAGSRHHGAFTNADFQRAYQREPLEFCRDCHAPARERMPAAAAEALGVGCLDCHADGQAAMIEGRDDSRVPHPLRRTPDFATQVCARCHEFEFPAESWRAAETMMQTTMREHRASAHAQQSCADCHMPAGNHDFASTRDPEAMRRALSVSARRDGNTLTLELTPTAVGHAFPTGDLFRRLELHAELQSADGEVLASTTRYLARHFRPRRRRDGQLDSAAEWVVDDRVVGPTTIELRLHARVEVPNATLVWWVDYERVDRRNAHAPERSTLADELRLAEGRL